LQLRGKFSYLESTNCTWYCKCKHISNITFQ